MIDVKRASAKLGELALLSYFPADDFARTALARIACEMATTNEQIEWLVTRCLQLWGKWEGPKEFRAVFCSKFKPADGVEVYSDLPQFLDGIPSERESAPLAIAAPPRDQNQLAGPVSAAPSIAATVADLVPLKDMNRIVRQIGAPRVRDIPERQVPAAERITAADIERAVQEMRAKKAAEEIAEAVTA